MRIVRCLCEWHLSLSLARGKLSHIPLCKCFIFRVFVYPEKPPLSPPKRQKKNARSKYKNEIMFASSAAASTSNASAFAPSTLLPFSRRRRSSQKSALLVGGRKNRRQKFASSRRTAAGAFSASASSSSSFDDDDDEKSNNTGRKGHGDREQQQNHPDVAWLPPLDRVPGDEADENNGNLEMRNERTFESRSGENLYRIARKDGQAVDETSRDFVEYKEKVDRVQDVMEFIARNKNWLKIARTQKMREYRAKMGLVDARLDDEEEEELTKDADGEESDVTVPEAFEHETFLDERGNITGRALYVCVTSFWLRVYYNLAQFELNASELDDIANRALVPKEKVSEWFEFARTNYNNLSAVESKEYYDCEMAKLKKFEQLVDEDFQEAYRTNNGLRLQRYYGEVEGFAAAGGFGMTRTDVENDPLYRAMVRFDELAEKERIEKEEEERRKREEEDQTLDRDQLERIFQDGSAEHPYLLDRKASETSGHWKTLKTDFDEKLTLEKNYPEDPTDIGDDDDGEEWLKDGGWEVLPDHTAVDARDGSALKFVGVKHAEDPETGKVTSDWNEAYDFSTWMYERPANATKYPVLDPIDQNDLLHLNKNQMPSADEMQMYESARKLVAGDDRNADRRIGEPDRKMLTRLEVGETLKAKVVSLDLYHGALVDCGTEIDGLIPIAEADIPRARVFLAVGSELEVKVSRIHSKFWRIRFPLEVMPVEQKILDVLKNGHPHDYDNPPINIYQGESDEFAFLDAGRDIRSAEAIAVATKRREEALEKRRMLERRDKSSMKRYEKAAKRATLASQAKKIDEDEDDEDDEISPKKSSEDLEIEDAHKISSKIRQQFEEEEEAALNKNGPPLGGGDDSARIPLKPRSSRQDEEDAEEGITSNRAAEDLQVAKLREGKAFVDPEADDLRGGFFGVNEDEDDLFDDEDEDDDDDEEERRRGGGSARASSSVLGIDEDDEDDTEDDDDDDMDDDEDDDFNFNDDDEDD